ncbi:unnamed protein product [Chrysoparadoxa australica]
MQVAFWEIAPYLPGVGADRLADLVSEYVRDNAGKAFEFMVEDCDAARKAKGLPPAEELRQAKGEDKAVLEVVDKHRQDFGLKTFGELRAPGGGEHPTLLVQQKLETVESLSKIASPCNGIKDCLDTLRKMSVQFCISTTSPKPRVPVSITSCGLDDYFPAEKVHSGESDFDPPRFKPDPSVYLKAAKAENMDPANCIAVEDSGSGVGSASNAEVGFIVGYVGASHISADMKDSHAKMLMSGSRAENGRGAEIVISHMKDLVPLVELFKTARSAGNVRPFTFPAELLSSMEQPVWVQGA